MNCLLLLSTTIIHSYATDTTIHAKKIGEQKIGEEHSAKNSPAKNVTRRKVRNPNNYVSAKRKFTIFILKWILVCILIYSIIM